VEVARVWPFSFTEMGREEGRMSIRRKGSFGWT
jgi:hypothetical protein